MFSQKNSAQMSHVSPRPVSVSNFFALLLIDRILRV